jgi:hypothetical protein
MQPTSLVDQLKRQIRDQVKLRPSLVRDVAGAPDELTELIYADERALERRLLEMQPRDLAGPQQTSRQPASYRVSDLLVGAEDEEFVWNAYRALLKRDPDDDGFQSHLKALRSGNAGKIDILGRLRYSPEGRRARVRVYGLFFRALLSKARRLLKSNANRDPKSEHHGG